MVFCSINEWCAWACSHITAVMASNELAAVRIISAFLLFSLSFPHIMLFLLHIDILDTYPRGKTQTVRHREDFNECKMEMNKLHVVT